MGQGTMIGEAVLVEKTKVCTTDSEAGLLSDIQASHLVIHRL